MCKLKRSVFGLLILVVYSSVACMGGQSTSEKSLQNNEIFNDEKLLIPEFGQIEEMALVTDVSTLATQELQNLVNEDSTRSYFIMSFDPPIDENKRIIDLINTPYREQFPTDEHPVVTLLALSPDGTTGIVSPSNGPEILGAFLPEGKTSIITEVSSQDIDAKQLQAVVDNLGKSISISCERKPIEMGPEEIPTQNDGCTDVVKQYESQGYKVIVQKNQSSRLENSVARDLPPKKPVKEYLSCTFDVEISKGEQKFKVQVTGDISLNFCMALNADNSKEKQDDKKDTTIARGIGLPDVPGVIGKIIPPFTFTNKAEGLGRLTVGVPLPLFDPNHPNTNYGNIHIGGEYSTPSIPFLVIPVLPLPIPVLRVEAGFSLKFALNGDVFIGTQFRGTSDAWYAFGVNTNITRRPVFKGFADTSIKLCPKADEMPVGTPEWKKKFLKCGLLDKEHLPTVNATIDGSVGPEVYLALVGLKKNLIKGYGYVPANLNFGVDIARNPEIRALADVRGDVGLVVASEIRCLS